MDLVEEKKKKNKNKTKKNKKEPVRNHDPTLDLMLAAVAVNGSALKDASLVMKADREVRLFDATTETSPCL